uniref:zinc finger protein 436-like isoform X1 n=1 Tax=Monopterus albus TaxID=43700 RepID=UPI0009B32A40|nr:zinc finger protein 436-like isoform X1 [Monopterus albus]
MNIRTTEAAGSRNEGRQPDDSDEGLTESKTDSLPSNMERKLLARQLFLPSPESSAAGSEGIGDEKKLDDGGASWRPAESEKPQKNNKTKLKIKTKCSVKLRVCLLEDSEISVLSNSVFKKYRPQELQCPCGLQEVDFLVLLRSTFPQLAADKPFDVFTTDHSRKLQPLKAETLTPEEIYRTIRSAGNSALYIRPKVVPHLFAEEARSNEGRKQDDSDEGLTESKTDSLSSNTRRKRSARRLFLPSSAGSATDSEEEADEKRKDGGDGDWRPAEGDKPWEQNSSKLKIKTKCSVKLRVCLLEDSKISVLSNSVFKKYRPQELQCPCGLQEVDFLVLLRSTFPQLAPDKPFDAFTTDHSRKLQPLKAETLTPEEIYRTIRSAGNSALYIQPKAGEELQASGQRELVQRKDDATTDSPSASTSVMASDETSSPDPHKRENMVDVLSHSSMSQQEVMETEEADDDAGISEPSDDVQACSFTADSEGDNGDEEEAEKMNGRDDGDWKPDGADEELEESRVKSMVTRKRTQSSTKVLTEQSVVSCKVCGALYKSKNAVSKHAWSHADDPERLCGVCGERSESPEELRLHLQTHLKTHSCNTCGKSFIGINAFMEHRAGHTGHKPYKCNVCNKAFLLKSKLAAHQKFHLGGKHKCHVCQKSFGCEVELKLHSSVHTGVKLYSCSVCGKSLSGLRALSHHMLTHSGEKRYGCQVCGKRFRLLYHLRGHKKIHTVREKPYLCDVCCKTFHTNSTLKAHMKIHNTACRERLHTCSKCGKGFMSQVGLLTHMKLHSEERPHSCPECGQSFKTKSNLKKHLILHSGDKQFVCSVCGKAWFHQEHLKVHMRTHNGERPFQCTLCDKAFTQSHCLKTHMKSHQGGQR